MKTAQKHAFLLGLGLFTALTLGFSSCGSDQDDNPGNPYFGRFPIIQKNESDELSRHNDQIPKEGFHSFEERKEFEKKEREIVNRYDEMMMTECRRINGRKIPLTIEDNVPFCISDSLTVRLWESRTSHIGLPFYIEGELEATRDIYLSEVGSLGGSMPKDFSYSYLEYTLPLYIYHTYGKDHSILPFDEMYIDNSFNSGYYMSIIMNAKDSSTWIYESLGGHEEHYGYLYYRSFDGASSCNVPEEHESYMTYDKVLRLPQYDLMDPNEVPLMRKGERIKIMFSPNKESKSLDFSGYKLSFTHPDPNHR